MDRLAAMRERYRELTDLVGMAELDGDFEEAGKLCREMVKLGIDIAELRAQAKKEGVVAVAKKSKKMLYFAYGSNLNIEQMGFRCPKAKPLGVSLMKDYVLEFRGSYSAVANVRRCKGSEVIGGLWEITKDCLEALDVYEGFPRLYRRVMVDVEYQGQMVQAIVYIMNKGPVIGLPSYRYYSTIREGYKDFGLDVATLEAAVVDAKEEVDAFTNWFKVQKAKKAN